MYKIICPNCNNEEHIMWDGDLDYMKFYCVDCDIEFHGGKVIIDLKDSKRIYNAMQPFIDSLEG